MAASPIVVHPVYGPAAPALGWVPAPRYWLRRQRILSLVKDPPRGTLLEVGCGAGALLSELGRHGFEAHAIETSTAARELARRFNNDPDGRRIREEVPPDWPAHFDLVVACEVLEHIEDDAAALRRWTDMLAPGGHLLLSVPAHPALWNVWDEQAGHCRRYTGEAMRSAIAGAGLALLHMEFYGYPLANVTERVRARFARIDADSQADRTAASGVERRLESRLWPLMANPVGIAGFRVADWMQRRFLRGERGNGLLALARRRS